MGQPIELYHTVTGERLTTYARREAMRLVEHEGWDYLLAHEVAPPVPEEGWVQSEPKPKADDMFKLGLPPLVAGGLVGAGFTTFAALAAADVADLTAVKGIGPATAKRVKAQAKELARGTSG